MTSDGQLVDRSLAGDRAAYAELVDRYERAVRVVALRLVGDHHAAEDVAQETFVTAFEKLSKLRRRDAFGAWLLTIARCEAVRISRGRRKEQASAAAGRLMARQEDADLGDANDALLRAIERLPEHERQIVLLRHFQSRSVQEIAQATGRPLGTVTKQLSRAYRRLKSWIREEVQP